ncbi:esterase/lipase family protein [Aciditerrimonas ferrireducens]|uniref:Esterase/lipase family protein n=1 Tax=Aciditerrimonas ferrireducens TaxID=667306 RepID=A0ABV6C4Q0_9ACTN
MPPATTTDRTPSPQGPACRPRRLVLPGVLALLLALGSLVLAAAPPASAATTPAAPQSQPAPRYPVGTALDGYLAEVLNPTSSPPGVDDWACRPTPTHPDPVILLPGTLYDVAETWQALGPILADHGYCVFGLNYGNDWLTTLTGGRVWAVGPIPRSAEQLAAFVQRVLAATGARQVDLVGWSQGGMMPRWYLRFDGGARFVHELVGLAPSNHGTTLDGLFALVDADQALGLPGPLTLAGCPACTEQQAGSPLLQQLNAGGDAQPGVREVVIETEDDEVVTPYTSAFLSGPGVTNITLQRQCPLDATDHLGIPYDPVALQDVLRALSGGSFADYQPVCSLSLPVLGGL